VFQKDLQPEYEKLVLRQAQTKWGTTTLALGPRVLILLVTGGVLFASKAALNTPSKLMHSWGFALREGVFTENKEEKCRNKREKS